jgi:hypothetical protein
LNGREEFDVEHKGVGIRGVLRSPIVDVKNLKRGDEVSSGTKIKEAENIRRVVLKTTQISPKRREPYGAVACARRCVGWRICGIRACCVDAAEATIGLMREERQSDHDCIPMPKGREPLKQLDAPISLSIVDRLSTV